MNSNGKLSTLTVFAGTRDGFNSAYRAAAATLGTLVARRGITLIFGGGEAGVMGAIADAALAEGGTVIGVVPEFISHSERVHPGVTEMIVTPDMYTRQNIMFDRADSFCILPGGVGTLDELFNVVTAKQLDRHKKPIIVLNTDGYWDKMLGVVRRIVEQGFIHEYDDGLLTVVRQPGEVLPAIEDELANSNG